MKFRVIPSLLITSRGLVKGKKFSKDRVIGAPLQALKVYERRQVDEMCLLFVDDYYKSMQPKLGLLADLAAECSVPITVGGGISTISHVEEVLALGADKVIINSAAYDDVNLIREVKSRFGRQAVVASVDYAQLSNGKITCIKNNGQEDTHKEFFSWISELEKIGVGEFFITSVQRDGTMSGYDLDTLRKIVSMVSVPVVVGGGAGSPQHVLEAAIAGAAGAVCSSIFAFTQTTPNDIKRHLQHHDVPTRLSVPRIRDIYF